jgi:hypothetical protein
MATLALSVAGQFAGGLVGGPLGAMVGRALGALAGQAVDGWLFGGEDAPPTGMDVRLGGSAEGIPIPRLYGWSRLSGNIIWARELVRLGGETAGAKGFETEEGDEVGASFAIGFCQGPVARLGRVWADGQLLDTRGLNLRFYSGQESQMPDGLIEATQGAGSTPAYRGLCYLVVENLPLSRFGNRIPQISAELCRPVGELESAIRAVTVIPGATEFGYDPVPRLRLLGPGEGVSENSHLVAGASNWSWSIDELQALCPNLERVALVVSWFGDDLRCGACAVTPRVEGAVRQVEGAEWSVAGLGRGEVPVVSEHAGGPAYGGTPSDASVLAAIADLKARGLAVTLYPLMMMDVPVGNGRPDPYGGAEQGAYPWRGRITCHPAEGRPGSPFGTAAAADQVAAFVPGYRDMIVHYAGLAVAAGGVDAFLIGSEMRGLTTVRGAGNSFPFVAALTTLAADVRAIVGPATRLSYAADWSEYSGVGSGGEKLYHLDPLWASPAIDAVGVDCYMPLSDWRDGTNHLDAALATSPYDLDYLGAGMAGGEGFDWYYASDADRRDQVRTPITDGAHGEPWIWRYKDLVSFWSQPHHDRPGGVRSATPTAWVPASKPIWLTELGCAAVDKGTNQPNIFGDPKSAENGRPYFSTGEADALMQRQFLRAHFRHWTGPGNPAGMVDQGHIYCWTWDARPYPAFPARGEVWSDGPNHATGHWLTGRLGGAASDELLPVLAAEGGAVLHADPAPPLVEGLVVGGPGPLRATIEPLLALSGLRLRAEQGGLVARSGATTVMSLDPDRLFDGDEPVIQRRRLAAPEQAARLALTTLDRGRDYQAATVTALRPGTGPLDTESLPVVLPPGAARRGAERLLDARRSAGDRIELALPPDRIALDVGDRIAVAGLAGGPFEITEIRDGAARRVTAEAVPPTGRPSVAADAPRGSAAAPLVAVAPLVVAAQLPPDAGDPTRCRLAIGAFARPWSGPVRVTAATGGTLVAELAAPAALGWVAEPFGVGPTGLWDRGRGLEVSLAQGHLSGRAEDDVLAGANRIAVETDAGDWEIVGFAEAQLLAPGRYRLTRLLRGLGGSDVAMGPVSAGRRVLVLDERVAMLPLEAARLGDVLALRVYAGAADLGGQQIEVTLGAGPLRPLPPAHLRATRRADGGIAIAWVRRSRADADGWGMAEPPLEAAPEAYRVSIWAGGVRVRSRVVGIPEDLYTAAEQSADFGGPAPALEIDVTQVSPVLGDGQAQRGVFNG